MVSVRQLQEGGLVGRRRLRGRRRSGGASRRYWWPEPRRVASAALRTAAGQLGCAIIFFAVSVRPLDARGGGVATSKRSSSSPSSVTPSPLESRSPYRSRCRNRSLPPYLSATSLPKLQIRRSYPWSRPLGEESILVLLFPNAWFTFVMQIHVGYAQFLIRSVILFR